MNKIILLALSMNLIACGEKPSQEEIIQTKTLTYFTDAKGLCYAALSSKQYGAPQADVYRTCKYYFPRYWSGEFDLNRWRFWLWGKE